MAKNERRAKITANDVDRADCRLGLRLLLVCCLLPLLPLLLDSRGREYIKTRSAKFLPNSSKIH